MGDFTIKQVLQFTRKEFPTRFDTRDRDVLRRIVVKERTEINVDHPERPQKRYKIITFSYPQYGEYLSQTGRRGRPRRYQRTVRHQYDQVLTVDDNLSINNTKWKYRLGSEKKWVKNPPQKHIKQLYSKTKNRFKRRAESRGDTPQERKQIYKELVNRHKRNAKYLSVGDYNAQQLGINGDFIFRDAWALSVHGHLYGQMHPKKPSNVTNPKAIPFFPKHGIHLIEELLQRGMLKDN